MALIGIRKSKKKQTKQWLDEKQQTDKQWFTKYYKKDLTT